MKAPEAGSASATELGAHLRTAAAALMSVLERIEPERWMLVPGPSVWSVGKDAEHVAEAALYHQWIVRLTIGREGVVTATGHRASGAHDHDDATTGGEPHPPAHRGWLGAHLEPERRTAGPSDAAPAGSSAAARRHDPARPDRPLRRASPRHRAEARRPDLTSTYVSRPVRQRAALLPALLAFELRIQARDRAPIAVDEPPLDAELAIMAVEQRVRDGLGDRLGLAPLPDRIRRSAGRSRAVRVRVALRRGRSGRAPRRPRHPPR